MACLFRRKFVCDEMRLWDGGEEYINALVGRGGWLSLHQQSVQPIPNSIHFDPAFCKPTSSFSFYFDHTYQNKPQCLPQLSLNPSSSVGAATMARRTPPPPPPSQPTRTVASLKQSSTAAEAGTTSPVEMTTRKKMEGVATTKPLPFTLRSFTSKLRAVLFLSIGIVLLIGV